MIVLGIPSFGYADDDKVSYVIIIDATKKALDENKSPYVAYVDIENNNSICDLQEMNNSPLSELKNRAKIIEECDDKRLMKSKGEKIKAIAFYSPTYFDKAPEVAFNEKKRKTKLGEDISVVINKLVDLNVPFNTEESSVDKLEKYHTLVNERATLEVVFAYSEKKSENVAKVKSTILTGPTEHWFLSVDLPVSTGEELKYDENTSQLVEKDTPSAFYLSANYMLGDILSDNISPLKKIIFKLSVKASSKPLDSYGLGIGYRFNDELNLGSKKLGGVSIFIGSFWDVEDDIKNGVVKTDSTHTQNWKVGVSFGLDKLTSWLD